GFISGDAILVAPESRTSSPIRIPRKRDTMEHEDVSGLYPCAEGAGYAGGIVSAAMDGQKVVQAIISQQSSLAEE
ncbi:MAG: FAD-binding protein, partial [Flavobacteriales bacterium]|nr:FAD-binding protein [Flavobacteriales bacterium]